MKIVVTGFKPFLNNEINPTEILVNLLELEGYDVEVIDVTYKDVDEFIDKLDQDTFLISLGLASSRTLISIEKYAYNKINLKVKDNSGFIPNKERIIEDDTKYLSTNINVNDFISLIPLSYISIDPGNYLCNYIYFKGLKKLNGNALFFHFPNIKENMYKYYLSNLKIIIEYINKIINK